MSFEGFERLSDGLQDGFVADAVTGMADEAGDAPAGGADAICVAYPTQFFLDPPGGGGEQVGKALATFEKHLERILQRWTSTHSNARMEGLNGLFQAARARARGYRNTATFITMIYLIAAPLENLFDFI